MKLAIFGYGKMGKEIERLALKENHEIVLRVSSQSSGNISSDKLREADVALEFSTPGSAYQNCLTCFNSGVNVVCGTTGWDENIAKVKQFCSAKNLGFFYASNFSIGVNMLFILNKQLARLMNNFPAYEPSIEEIHHVRKLDSPSGTAITLSKDIISEIKRKKSIKNILLRNTQHDLANYGEALPVFSIREGDVIGTHSISYSSDVDTLQIRHEAHSREAFARGALMAANWMYEKKGIFDMSDLLKLND